MFILPVIKHLTHLEKEHNDNNTTGSADWESKMTTTNSKRNNERDWISEELLGTFINDHLQANPIWRS